MTTTEARDDLLSMIGVEDPAHASESVHKRILSDINVVLQKIYSMAMPWWSSGRSGGILKKPVILNNLRFQNASEVINSNSSFLPAMAGNTIRVGDDPDDNEIKDFISANSVTLVRPFRGTTATSNGVATLYCDTIILPQDTMSVVPPVFIQGEHELKSLRSQNDVMLFSVGSPNDSYSDNFWSTTANNRDEGTPIGYYIEPYIEPLTKNTKLRLRVSPLPDRDYTLRFDVRLSAPRVSTIEPASELPIPLGYAESIFLPILRFQFSTWRHVNLGNQSNELKQQYDEAWQILAKLKPQPLKIGRVKIVY